MVIVVFVFAYCCSEPLPINRRHSDIKLLFICYEDYQDQLSSLRATFRYPWRVGSIWREPIYCTLSAEYNSEFIHHVVSRHIAEYGFSGRVEMMAVSATWTGGVSACLGGGMSKKFHWLFL